MKATSLFIGCPEMSDYVKGIATQFAQWICRKRASVSGFDYTWTWPKARKRRTTEEMYELFLKECKHLY